MRWLFHRQKPTVAFKGVPKDFSISQWSILCWQRNKYCSDWTPHICQCTGIKLEAKITPPSEQVNRASCFSFWSLCWQFPHFWEDAAALLTYCWLGKPIDISCSSDISPNCSKEMERDLLLLPKAAWNRCWFYEDYLQQNESMYTTKNFPDFWLTSVILPFFCNLTPQRYLVNNHQK